MRFTSCKNEKGRPEMREWRKELRTTVTAVLSLAVIVGGIYPLAVWVLTQGLFPARATGSWLARSGEIVGSRLLGQSFTGPGYFQPRPSAAGGGYDPRRSGGSNLGPTSKRLVEGVAERVAAYRAENGLPAEVLVPADAVTASGSGLDPHISLANARLQAPRVARTRGSTEAEIRRLIDAATEGRDLGILGEPRVNVLLLNLALDGAADGGK
jgi:potassium-transporting ATPase KdpC subunit